MRDVEGRLQRCGGRQLERRSLPISLARVCPVVNLAIPCFAIGGTDPRPVPILAFIALLPGQATRSHVEACAKYTLPVPGDKFLPIKGIGGQMERDKTMAGDGLRV